VIVAVVLVRAVQTPIDQEVDVVVVGHRLVPASRAVLVVGAVPAGSHGVPVGMGGVHRDHVLIDVAVVGVVQVALVQVVEVVVVTDSGVSATGPVDVVVRFVDLMFVVGHGRTVGARRR
jgi:hypothetical protein